MQAEEVGHDYVYTKSGRVPYIEILYYLQIQAKKPWRQFKGLTVLKYTQMKILAQYPARPPFRKRIKISETLAIYVTLLCHAFLKCGLSHHCNGVVIIPVINLDRNNTPKVSFSFAGFVHVCYALALARVFNAHNAYQCHVIIT